MQSVWKFPTNLQNVRTRLEYFLKIFARKLEKFVERKISVCCLYATSKRYESGSYYCRSVNSMRWLYGKTIKRSSNLNTAGLTAELKTSSWHEHNASIQNSLKSLRAHMYKIFVAGRGLICTTLKDKTHLDCTTNVETEHVFSVFRVCRAWFECVSNMWRVCFEPDSVAVFMCCVRKK